MATERLQGKASTAEAMNKTGPHTRREETVKRWVIRTIAVLGILGAGAALRLALAEPPADGHGGVMEMDHRAGHRMDGSSDDGAFHRRFDDAAKWAKDFDNPERDAWQKPDEVIDALHLESGSSVADIGAGTGYFSVRIAKRIPDGKVFAVDVEPDMVRYLGERGQAGQLANHYPILASADAANLSEPVDLILVVDTYHHIGHRRHYFAKLKSSLKPNGRLAIVDFKAESPNGPPPRHRISPETVKEEMTEAGYALLETHEFLPRQYFLVFRNAGS